MRSVERRVTKVLDQGEEAQSGVEDTVGKIPIQTSVKKNKAELVWPRCPELWRVMIRPGP